MQYSIFIFSYNFSLAYLKKHSICHENCDVAGPLPEYHHNNANEMSRVGQFMPFRNYPTPRYPGLFSDLEKRHFTFRELYFQHQATAADRMSAFQYVRNADDYSKR